MKLEPEQERAERNTLNDELRVETISEAQSLLSDLDPSFVTASHPNFNPLLGHWRIENNTIRVRQRWAEDVARFRSISALENYTCNNEGFTFLPFTRITFFQNTNLAQRKVIYKVNEYRSTWQVVVGKSNR